MCAGHPGSGSIVCVSLVGHTAKLESLIDSIHLFGHVSTMKIKDRGKLMSMYKCIEFWNFGILTMMQYPQKLSWN